MVRTHKPTNPKPIHLPPPHPPLVPSSTDRIETCCDHCGTRLRARVEFAGRRHTCPQCGSAIVVVLPESDEFELEPPPLRPSVIPPAAARQKPATTAMVSAYERRELPRYPLLSGIWQVPFRRGAFVLWLLLSAWSAIVWGLILFSLDIYAQGYGAFVAVCGFAAAGILGLLLALTAAATWVTLLTHTSDGEDQIESWPGLMFLDWMFDGVCVLMAAAIGVFPGWLMTQFYAEPLWRWIAITGGFLISFPIAVLSMLDADSVLCPVTPRVIASIRRCSGTWLLFLFESAVLAGGLMAVFGAAAAADAFATIGVMPLAVMVSFWYFRLLGRLAWVIGESAPRE